MNLYLGYDIGTTNCKVLAYDGDGRLAFSSSFPTPYSTIDGHRYFDLGAIDAFVDDAEEKAKAMGRLVSVGFSSIGESTVPVAEDGRRLFDPPLWSDMAMTSTREEAEVISRHNSFRTIGIISNGLLSLDKILWFRRHYPEEAAKARYHLPVTSWELFRKTGKAVWDYSQALRSNAFLVHERKWNSLLLEELGLREFGDLEPMGRGYEGKDSVVYGLGGHDHITGLFGINAVANGNGKPFFYESMGTSAVLTMYMTDGEENYPSLASYNPPEGSFVPGFDSSSFILTRSFRSFGRLNAIWPRLSGSEDAGAFFASCNKAMMERPFKGLSFLMESDSDFIRGNTRDGALNLYRFNAGADMVDMVESTYLYLSIGASALEKTLRGVVGNNGGMEYLAGGAVTKDETFMRYRASALGHSIRCLRNKEVSAMGAVFTGISGAGDKGALEALRAEALVGEKIYEPDEEMTRRVAAAREEYDTFISRLKRGERI